MIHYREASGGDRKEGWKIFGSVEFVTVAVVEAIKIGRNNQEIFDE
jgi:hypothetical protein